MFTWRGLNPYLLLLLVLCMLTGLTHAVLGTQQGIESVEYVVFYNPIEGTGVLSVSITMSLAPGEIGNVDLPIKIFGDASLYFFNYTMNPPTGSLVVNYNDDTGVASLLVSNASRVTLYFTVSNLTEEASIGSYTATLDLLDYASGAVNVSVEIYLTGIYDVIIDSYPRVSGYSIQALTNTTVIRAYDPAIYFIVLKIPVNTASPSSTQFNLLNLLFPLLLITVVAAVIIVLRWRRTSIGRIEKVNVLNDPVSRSIIRALGEAGDAGLTQAEITNRTGIPKSSVSRRIRRLEEEGFITVARTGKYNYLRLTDKGKEAYRRIVEKK
ncbi:helix-turn-helix transcriptional regulator [Desulfurococcus amylolyticus]|nr:transcriptional regulator [Desulfurococcus amylolyticus]